MKTFFSNGVKAPIFCFYFVSHSTWFVPQSSGLGLSWQCQVNSAVEYIVQKVVKRCDAIMIMEDPRLKICEAKNPVKMKEGPMPWAQNM